MATGTLKWLGPGYFGSKVAPGDDMPDIDKKRLEKFIKAGKVGTIAEKIDLEKIESKRVKGLEKENAAIKKQFGPLEKRCSSLEDTNSLLSKEISALNDERSKFIKTNTEILNLNVDLVAKLKLSEDENFALKSKVSSYEKEIADLVKVSKKKDK